MLPQHLKEEIKNNPYFLPAVISTALLLISIACNFATMVYAKSLETKLIEKSISNTLSVRPHEVSSISITQDPTQKEMADKSPKKDIE